MPLPPDRPGLVWSRSWDLGALRGPGVLWVEGGLAALVHALIELDTDHILRRPVRRFLVQLDPAAPDPEVCAVTAPTSDVWSPDGEVVDGPEPQAPVGSHARHRLVRGARGADATAELEHALGLVLLGRREQAIERLDAVRTRLTTATPEPIEERWLSLVWNRLDVDELGRLLARYRRRFGETLDYWRLNAYLDLRIDVQRPEDVARLQRLVADPTLPADRKPRLLGPLLDAQALTLEAALAVVEQTRGIPRVVGLEAVTGVAEHMGRDDLVRTHVPRLLDARAAVGDRMDGGQLLSWLALTGQWERAELELEQLDMMPIMELVCTGLVYGRDGNPRGRNAFRDALDLTLSEYPPYVVAAAAGLASTDAAAGWEVVSLAEEHAEVAHPDAAAAKLCVQAGERHPVDAARWYLLASRLWGAVQHWAHQTECIAAAAASGRTPLGPYDLLWALGEGGFGQVYQAEHRPTGAMVALKVLHREVSAETRAALRREVETQARLHHPAVLRVLAVGAVPELPEGHPLPLEAGAPYMTLELATGGSLQAYQGELPPEQLVDLLLAVLDALAHCHARGTLHLDLKPENLLMGADGAVRLADFGLAGLLGTRAESGHGTPHYMAPEHWRREALDARTDLYALGCVAFALAAGHPPFEGTVPELLAGHLHDALPPTGHAGLDVWIAGCTAKIPAARFRSAAAAAAALRAVDIGGVRPSASTRRRLPTFTLHSMALPDLLDAAGPGGEGADDGLQPLPVGWRTTGAEPAWSVHRRGLAPLASREVALVGREPLQDALWSALRAAAAGGAPVGVALVGEPGVGRSAVLRWLVHRARELDVAEVSAELMPPSALTIYALDPLPSEPELRRFLAETRGAALVVGVADRAPEGFAELAVPPLSAAALHTLGLRWARVPAWELHAAVEASGGRPGALKRALAEGAPPALPRAGTEPVHGPLAEVLEELERELQAGLGALSRLVRAPRAHAASDATPLLHLRRAFGKRGLDPGHDAWADLLRAELALRRTHDAEGSLRIAREIATRRGDSASWRAAAALALAHLAELAERRGESDEARAHLDAMELDGVDPHAAQCALDSQVRLMVGWGLDPSDPLARVDALGARHPDVHSSAHAHIAVAVSQGRWTDALERARAASSAALEPERGRLAVVAAELALLVGLEAELDFVDSGDDSVCDRVAALHLAATHLRAPGELAADAFRPLADEQAEALRLSCLIAHGASDPRTPVEPWAAALGGLRLGPLATRLLEQASTDADDAGLTERAGALAALTPRRAPPSGAPRSA